LTQSLVLNDGALINGASFIVRNIHMDITHYLDLERASPKQIDRPIGKRRPPIDPRFIISWLIYAASMTRAAARKF
jgi:hypothetical protein